MNPLIVLAGIIRYKDTLLIAKRYVKELNAFKWEFPGGKLEENEGLRDCLKREIKEELNLNITVGEIFEVVYHRYSDKDVLILAYLCQSKTDKAKAIDCEEYKWIRLKELKAYDFLAADEPIVDKILRTQKH